MFPIFNFKVLRHYGNGDGTLLTPGYNVEEIINRYIVIKKIRVDYYLPAAGAAYEVLFINDSISQVPGAGARYLIKSNNNLINSDDFARLNSLQVLKIFINGNDSDILPVIGTVVNNPKIDIDNIYGIYPERIGSQGLNGKVSATFYYPDGSGFFTPQVNLVLEVFLIGNLDDLKFVEPKTLKLFMESNKL